MKRVITIPLGLFEHAPAWFRHVLFAALLVPVTVAISLVTIQTLVGIRFDTMVNEWGDILLERQRAFNTQQTVEVIEAINIRMAEIEGQVSATLAERTKLVEEGRKRDAALANRVSTNERNINTLDTRLEYLEELEARRSPE